MLLQQSSLHTLQSLRILLDRLTPAEYGQPLPVLSGSSIGKHVRHILEFYECLFQNLAKGYINYDARQRNLRLETEREFALDVIMHLSTQIESISQDMPLQLQVAMDSSDVSVCVPTTLYRELVYNIEHCIHHLALIRVGVETTFAHVSLPAQLGVAYSTIRYQESQR